MIHYYALVHICAGTQTKYDDDMSDAKEVLPWTKMYDETNII